MVNAAGKTVNEPLIPSSITRSRPNAELQGNRLIHWIFLPGSQVPEGDVSQKYLARCETRHLLSSHWIIRFIGCLADART
jgi:hypothetical protein